MSKEPVFTEAGGYKYLWVEEDSGVVTDCAKHLPLSAVRLRSKLRDYPNGGLYFQKKSLDISGWVAYVKTRRRVSVMLDTKHVFTIRRG